MLQAKLIHAMPGRLRLRFSSLRGKQAALLQLQQEIGSLEAVQDCKLNPATASVVIRYRGERGPLLDAMRERIAGLSIETGEKAVSSGRGILRKPIRIVSGREITPMFVLGSAMLALGAVQLVRRRIAVPSITAFWYGIDALRHSRKRGEDLNIQG